MLKNLLKYLTAATVLAAPIYPKFPFITIPMTSVSIRLEDFLIAAVALIYLINFLPEVKKILSRKLERSIVIFLVVGLVSLFSALYLTHTVETSLGLLHWARRVEYFVLFFVAVEIFRKKQKSQLEFYIKILMLVVVIAGIYGFGQKHFDWPVIATQNLEVSKGIALRWLPGAHLNSTFAGHYDLATFLVLTLPIFICWLLLVKGKWSKAILASVIVIGVWLMANTLSRISVVSFLFAITVSLLLIKKYKAIPVIILLSILFFSFSQGLLARYSRVFEVAKERLQEMHLLMQKQSLEVYAQEELPERRGSMQTEEKPQAISIFEDRSTSIRLNVEWPRALRALFKNPLLGTGYSSITLATDNDYLRLLGEVGILGFSAFILVLVRIISPLRRLLPLTKKFSGIKLGVVSGFTGGYLGLLVNALFIDIFEASKVAIIFWFLAGVYISLIRPLNEKTNHGNI